MTLDQNLVTDGIEDDIDFRDKCIPNIGSMAASGHGTEENERQCIDCLLTRTNIRYWRPALLDMMKVHLNHESMLSMLRFLLSNIDSALEAYAMGRYSLLHVNYAQAPADLDLVNWRRILVGIHLVLCEPDTNFDIGLIGISVGESTNYSALKGMQVLLQSLLELPWNVIRVVVHLTLQEASVLYETLTDTSLGYRIPLFCEPSIKTMYEDQQKRDLLRKVGFYRRSANEAITWCRPTEVNIIESVLRVLQGLYRTPSGVQTSTQ